MNRVPGGPGWHRGRPTVFRTSAPAGWSYSGGRRGLNRDFVHLPSRERPISPPLVPHCWPGGAPVSKNSCEASSCGIYPHHAFRPHRLPDPRGVPQVLRGARPPPRRLLLPRPPERPHPAVHQRGHGPVQGRVHRPREARLHPRHHLAEVRARRAASTTTSTTSATPPATTRSSRCSATSPSATTSRRTPSPTAGSSSPRRWGSTKERLAVTVFNGEGGIPWDEEAFELWAKQGVPRDRILKLGLKDNFWAMGDTGPCGPCSEIHFHQGDDIPCAEEAAGKPCQGVACDCDRWLEIWNLVFMQFERKEKDAPLHPAAQAVHRHGRGPGAHGLRRPGQALQLRHGPVPGHHRQGERAGGQALHARSGGASHAGDRGPQPRAPRSSSPTACSPPTRAAATCCAASCAAPSATARCWAWTSCSSSRWWTASSS